MFDALILLVLAAIAVSLGSGLFFLVKDRSKSTRTVRSLSVRVALSVLLLAILAFGFFTRFVSPGG